jgi:ubiquinone/menaquinone biosynthesis C-methylase UbiE
MACHGGFSLDETTRRSWYNPEAILTNLKTGMTFADIGCGDGFFSILAAKIVGEKGKVYAVDIDGSGIEKLQQKAQSAGLRNIETKVNAAENVIFCEKCVDLVFFSMDLHDFTAPRKVLINAKHMLKANGLLVDLDWKKIAMQFGPPVGIRFSEQHASEMISSAGFTVISVENAGPYHYVINAKP